MGNFRLKAWHIVVSVIVIVLIILGICAGNLWTHRMEIISLENQIEAQHVSNKSNYDNMWKTFKEMTQVTELQAEQFKDVYTDLITGRNQDPELLFKMVQENNPQLGTQVYSDLQNAIESGRKTFDNNQKRIADIIREYNTQIDRYVILNSFMNRQKKNSDDYIITSDRTKQAYENGGDDAIDLKGE